ncbi:MAG TPA: YqaJ viral recombinase family protein [Steroidobacteraceae bacterium]|nr:YqaJ viral recombinase family protein [Steroidobacteraceae bacterium]
MITHDLVQGSDEWDQFRLEHDGASEAAAMLGLSLNVKRSELLRMKHTGIAHEFSDWVRRNVLARGHEVEAMARPHIEEMLGRDLYPVTCSDGNLSASCDGLTADDSIAMEHKQWSESLAARVSAGELPEEHMPQCQQVLMVTGAERLIFVVSDGTPKNMVYIWVLPDPVWFRRLRDGWDQFHRDLAAYVLPEEEPAKPIGKAPETLPALRIEVSGQVTASNLSEFKQTALTAIRSVNRDLSSDADFADAEKAVKWCSDVEDRLAEAKQRALSQTSSIDALFKAIDDISAEARRVRLDLDKLVTRRKIELKEAEVVRALDALAMHIEVVNAEIAPAALRPMDAGFGAAIKGLKTLASVRDKLGAALANAKIDADAKAKAIRCNLNAFKPLATGVEFLFADLAYLVHKPADDFDAQVRSRIAAHKEAEVERERAALAWKKSEDDLVSTLVLRSEPYAAVESVRIAATDVSPHIDEPATLKLGTICERLGLMMTAAFVGHSLGVKPSGRAGAAVLFRESDFARICAALQKHIEQAYASHWETAQ